MSEFDTKASPIRRGSVNISYIFGRMNPPHAGHIHLISEMIFRSQDKGADPLIILGNGPSKGNPLDDPLEFELKRDIIIDQLTKRGISPGRYTIAQIDGRPTTNIIKFVGDSRNIDDMTLTYFAGNKPGKNEGDEGDADKMDWIPKTLFKHFNEIRNVEFGKQSIDPVITGQELMSGTIVRKSVYAAHLHALNEDMSAQDEVREWSNANPGISEFYGILAPRVYGGVLGPLDGMSVLKQKTIIGQYLSPTTGKSSTRKTKTSPSTKTTRKKGEKGTNGSKGSKGSKGGKQKSNKTKKYTKK